MSSATESQSLLHHSSRATASDSSANQLTISIHNKNNIRGPGKIIRPALRRFLTSKVGHYAVLLLVALDISCIFADFVLNLYICTMTCRMHPGHVVSVPTGAAPNFKLGTGSPYMGWDSPVGTWEEHEFARRAEKAKEILGATSLAITYLFMAELLASIWAFGWNFFKSKFHIFDAIVIIFGFIIDVCLEGILEDMVSLVVVLRLWRVFKIIEEFSAGAEVRIEEIQGYVEKLEHENKTLKAQIDAQNLTSES